MSTRATAALALVALAVAQTGCALSARRQLGPDLVLVRINLVGRRSQWPIDAAPLAVDDRGRRASAWTDCAGRGQLRLPPGRWTVTVGPSRACYAKRQFTVVVTPGQSTTTVRQVLDDDPNTCAWPPPKGLTQRVFLGCFKQVPHFNDLVRAPRRRLWHVMPVRTVDGAADLVR